MSEMVGKVALAIAAVPQIFVRSADDGFEELCRYGEKDEPEIVVLSRVHPEDDFESVRSALISRLRARAAIEAMREPTMAMCEADHAIAWQRSDTWVECATETWHAMIDAALERKKA